MMKHVWTALTVLFFVAVSSPLVLAAQEKPALSAQEYGRWESLGRSVISPFGDWVATVVTRNDEDSELRITRVSDTDETVVVPFGQTPSFSPDGQWVTWFVGAGPDGDEDAELTTELMNLQSGDRTELGEASAVAFGPAGASLAVLSYPNEDDSGSDLRIVSLADRGTTTFGSVSAMAWHDTESLLAMTLATDDGRGNGLQVYATPTGAVRGLHSSTSEYLPPVWREGEPDVLVLRSVEPAEEEGDEHELLAWRGLDGSAAALALDPASAGVAGGLFVAGQNASWSPDGERISFGLRPDEGDGEDDADREDEDDADDDAEGVEGGDGEADTDPDRRDGDADSDSDEPEVASVQIWHSGDVRSVPQQISGAAREERATYLAVWNLNANRVIQVGTDLLESASVLGDWQHGIEELSGPYPWGNMFGRRFHDVWVVDLDDGERRLALERVRYSWESAGGRYLLWYDGDTYQAQEVSSGTVTNLTAGINTVFANTEWDTPVDDFVPAWGVGGWLEGDEAVLLYDQFDVWRVALDGSGGPALTQGAAGSVVHRMQDLDPAEPAYDANELLFSTRGEWTEDRGFARWTERGGYDDLVSVDRYFSMITKADSADVVVYCREAKTDAPDVFVSNGRFESPRLVLESNPFMDEYAWPTTEFVDYTNAEGKRLHGTLIYPANHDPSQRYPMIVYAYELLTPQTHRWVNPTERSYYNQLSWAHEGYFVLLPDIVFRGRDPGVSVAETMDAAISAVDAMGVINRDQVGFVGHSWGGYEGAFLGARTDLFAVTVAGAPLTDFVSFMGQFHWNGGNPESSHWETGQARMAVPYWEDPAAHERNSPLHGVQDMTTPILMAHGDSDGVVEYFQSTVFYNFVRRAGKEMVLLTYEGEDHGFRQKANQIDYHRRILEWFDHHLRGNDAQTWVTEGVLWKDHDEEKKRVAKKGGGA